VHGPQLHEGGHLKGLSKHGLQLHEMGHLGGRSLNAWTPTS
jgi:hypothetical protein